MESFHIRGQLAFHIFSNMEEYGGHKMLVLEGIFMDSANVLDVQTSYFCRCRLQPENLQALRSR
jgi:hypothetical protein